MADIQNPQDRQGYYDVFGKWGGGVYDAVQNEIEGIQKRKQKKVQERLDQRMLARSRAASASTPNVLGGGIMGRKAPSGPTTSNNLLNSINSMPSLLGDM